LAAAKRFFSDKLKEMRIEQIESLYTKLTQHFLFNIYAIAGDVDVFVAFETMNVTVQPTGSSEGAGRLLR
jgi:hypothetical protein